MLLVSNILGAAGGPRALPPGYSGHDVEGGGPLPGFLR